MSDFGAPPPRPSTARLSMPPMAALSELPRPRVIAVSFWSWIIGGVVLGATVALAATKVDPMHAEFARLARDRDPDTAAATINSVATASVLVVIGAGGLLAVLGMAFAAGLRAARGWARVFLTLIAIAGVGYAALMSSALTSTMLGELRAPVIAGLLGYTVLVLVAAVWMFLPGTRDWFRRPNGG
jgi:hypothetical protein